MSNPINISNEENRKLLVKEARQLFVSNMKALGHASVKHGGDLLPRSIWSAALALALAEKGVITPEQADAVAVVLNSELGNSSQLGAQLKKDGDLAVESVANATQSLASLLAARAQQAQS